MLRNTLALVFLLSLAFSMGANTALAACDQPRPELFAAASPSVVRVTAVVIDPYRLVDRVQVRVGSGFVIDPGDLVVTNAHVVFGAKTLLVQSGDGPPLEVKLVGADPVLDLAVLRLEPAPPKPLPALRLGQSGALRVGEDVMAIGNPFGIGQTATAGVVSALNRVLPVSTMSYLTPFIQFDAAVNPGNSGGPLMNRCGEVVGITTAGIKQAQSIGFAVPVDLLKKAVPELVEHGHVARPWYGIYGRMFDPAFSPWMGFPLVQGFLVETVEPGSPAEKIGLRGGNLPIKIGTETLLLGGDIITAVDGVPITDMETVRRVINGLKVGQKVHIAYARADAGLLSADVVLPERPTLPTDFEFANSGE